jgi:hypothetical protein
LNQGPLELISRVSIIILLEMEFKPLLIFLLLALVVVAESEKKKVVLIDSHHSRRLEDKRYIDYGALKPDLPYCGPEDVKCQPRAANPYTRPCTRANHCTRDGP